MTDRKSYIISTLSSFNTLLDDFPSLLNVVYDNGDESTDATISFLLSLAGMFGLGEEKLLAWLSGILNDDESKGTKGALRVIEESIKGVLVLYFTSLYTCEIEPFIPDNFLLGAREAPDGTKGVKIPVRSIDRLGVLKSYPMGDIGSMFYFDVNNNGIDQPNHIYRSTDMNAWLWFVINRTAQPQFGSRQIDARAIWDNRAFYKNVFDDDEKNTQPTGKRQTFVDTIVENSQLYSIPNVGFKKNIIRATYQETGSNIKDSDTLRVYGCAETYKGTGLMGSNKTVLAFNTDYIYSLRLFNSKTLVTQIVNAIIGVASEMTGSISLEMNILIQKIEKTVDLVMANPKSVTEDNFFEFSEEQYAEIANDADIKYHGLYETHNEINEIVKPDLDGITTAIRKIDSARTSEEKEEAIQYTLTELCGVSTKYSAGINSPFVASRTMIEKFIKELITQVSLQILSPKVMILFAINDYFLSIDNEGKSDVIELNIEAFMKGFWNIIKSCVLKVADLILNSLFDLVIGFVRPILTLVAEKLLLETLMYYKETLSGLIRDCLPSLTIRRGNFVIDDVNYADIIPTQTEPAT